MATPWDRSVRQSEALQGRPLMMPPFGRALKGWGALAGRVVFGDEFPWRCHGLEEKCPLRGVGFGEQPRRFSEQGGTVDPRGSYHLSMLTLLRGLERLKKAKPLSFSLCV